MQGCLSHKKVTTRRYYLHSDVILDCSAGESHSKLCARARPTAGTALVPTEAAAQRTGRHKLAEAGAGPYGHGGRRYTRTTATGGAWWNCKFLYLKIGHPQHCKK